MAHVLQGTSGSRQTTLYSVLPPLHGFWVLNLGHQAFMTNALTHLVLHSLDPRTVTRGVEGMKTHRHMRDWALCWKSKHVHSIYLKKGQGDHTQK